MTNMVQGLFGGDSSAKKEAAKQRQLQQVANDRQLSELNRESSSSAISRRAPRGRRLFEDDAAGGTADTVLS